jgi:hypothetical protein
MSVNKFRPHVFVLPEDDANSDIANGFLLHESVDSRSIQVMPTAGGWTKACDKLAAEYITIMRNNANTHVVLLIDFDDQEDRRAKVHDEIPSEFGSRVFIIGAKSVPEDLRRARLGTFEEIGRKLAEDCRSGSRGNWDHELLRHNLAEVDRMSPILKPIIFRD